MLITFSGNLKNRSLVIQISHQPNFAKGYLFFFSLGFLESDSCFEVNSSSILLI